MESVVDKIKLCIWVAYILMSVVCLILYLISRLSKNKETKQKATDAMQTTQSMLDVLYLVQNAVIGAESNQNFTNKEKFNSAFIAVKNELFKQNKDIADDTLTDLIENQVVVSQKVNSDEKQKAKSDELKKIEIIKEE